MKPATSPAYWPLRILLALGIVSVAAILWWAVVTPVPATLGGSVIAFGPLSLDAPMAWRILVIGIPVVGLLVQIRVLRALGDEAPPWRYRDDKGASPLGEALGPHLVALIMLALGVGLAVLVVGSVLLGPTSQGCFGCDDPELLGVPASVVTRLVAIGLALAGTAWLVRIYRRMP